GGSLTGSLFQPVSRLAWLLPAQVQPEPLSETRKPKFGFATTLTQGAGGIGVRITYSCPSGVKPPQPLSKSRSVRRSAGLAGSAFCRRLAATSRGGGRGVISCRSTCAASDP